MRNQLKNKINAFGIPTNSKQSILNSYLKKEFIKAGLFDKDIIVSDLNLNQSNNLTYLNLKIFSRTAKVIKYRRLLRNAKSNFDVKSTELNSLTKLFEDRYNNKDLNIHNLVMNITNLNTLIKSNNVEEFFDTFKKFSTVLFSRGYNLFLDFIKLTALLNEKHINASTYLLILGQVFKNLNKKKHSNYIQFIKTICDILVEKKVIKGIKFSISGRILGKTRASCVKIERGAISLNTINSNNQFSKLHVYTIYGAYGLKLWISYN
jgi:hypothetical protein